MNKIFECIVGSHAYGTNIETSDVDIKGVFCQPNEEILGLKYQEQLNPDKDTTYYEIRRFIELAGSANPTILEMLFIDDKFIKKITPAFQLIRDVKEKFLTKNCANSFGGYAVAQIKKAKGLNKKMNWEKERIERKEVLDFCFASFDGKSLPIKDFLKKEGMKQEFCGLSSIPNFPNTYALFYDWVSHYNQEGNRGYVSLGFKGIVGEDSNEVRLSSIPKDLQIVTNLYFNKDSYSIHCKEYREYQEWLEKRNTDRYVDTSEHGQQIDGKNLMHCTRLIDCALEIAQTGTFEVFRPNKEYLLSIRKGKVDLNKLIEEAEAKLLLIDELFVKSDLPEKVDFEFKHDLLVQIRKENESTLNPK